MAEFSLYLGMDIEPDHTQLSYYNIQKREPESVSDTADEASYLLPNTLYVATKTEQTEGEADRKWYVGSQAMRRGIDGSGMLVDDIYNRVMLNDDVWINDKKYRARDLFVKMARLHLEEFLKGFDEYTIEKLVVTVADTDPYIIDALRKLRIELKLDEEQFEIQGHERSAVYYIFHQPEVLRNNSVALFDYSKKGLFYYSLSQQRNRSPYRIEISEADFSDKMTRDGQTADKEDLDDLFLEVVKETVTLENISSVYLTGVGFDGDWMERSTNFLCQGRRVFAGQNMYVKGACYRAFAVHEKRDVLDNYIICSDTVVMYDVGINLMDNANSLYIISEAGREWFNTKNKISIFLDDTDRLDIVFRNMLTGDKTVQSMQIAGLPKRPPKTTKISLEVEFYDSESGAMIIRDEGFGMLYPTTNKIYRKEFDLHGEDNSMQD